MTPTTGSAPAIFPVMLGGNTFGWTSDESESFAVLDAYVAHGGDAVDTADAYSAWVPGHRGGESELVIGRWLARRPDRDRLLIGTKVSRHPEFPGLSRRNVLAAAEASLRRLGTDTIGVYYPHYDDPSVPIEETVEAFHDLQVAGKIRHVGLSNYRADRVTHWLAVAAARGFEPPVFLQSHYNLAFRADHEKDLAPLADREGIAVVPYFALASGLLTGKYRNLDDVSGTARERFLARYVSPAVFEAVSVLVEIAESHGVAPATVALAWLLTRPGVVAPIASARTVQQLPDLLRCAELVLSADEVAQLDASSARIG